MIANLKPYPETKDSGIEWLGEIPVHWDAAPIKWLARIVNGATPRSGKTEYWDGEIVWVTPDDLGHLESAVLLDTSRHITESGYASCGTTLVPSGSLILSTRAPIGHLAIAGTPVCMNQGCRGLVLTDCAPTVFRYYSLLVAKTVFQSLGQGSTFLELSRDKLGNVVLPNPTASEQRAIVDFLDRETVKIDALVEKKKRLIKLLHEKRTALITHAVTKGLDPNVPMRDSGIEWLGQIPVHWDTGRVGMFSQQVTDGAHISPDTTFPDYPFVSTVDIVGGRIDFENCLGTTSDTYAYMERTGCRPCRGDVLFSKDGTVGRTTVVDTDAEFVVASSLVIISPRKEAVVPRHLEYWLNGAFIQELVELHLSGAALRRISVAKVGNLPIALPPLDEQRAVADCLDRETTKLDTLIAKIQEAIERLKEYRIALISAAVTGKIDVRNE